MFFISLHRACMHDPDVFPDPFEFLPERFIRDGKYDAGARDPIDFAFGFGRRYVPLSPSTVLPHSHRRARYLRIVSVLEGTLRWILYSSISRRLSTSLIYPLLWAMKEPPSTSNTRTRMD